MGIVGRTKMPKLLNDYKGDSNSAGLDIGYVPARPDAFFRWSGQFGPQQLNLYWPAGPVDFFFFFFFFFF